VRKLAIGISVFLVFVTAAAAASQVTSQKALEAPRPSGAQSKGGLVDELACVSAKSCAAVGAWLYTEQSGEWAAAKVPSVPHTGGTVLRSLDCAAAGKCVAVGRAGVQHIVEASESGRKWSIGQLELPVDAAPVVKLSGPLPSLDSLSCSSPRNCLAAGYYVAADRLTHPLLVAENGGNWSAGEDGAALLPANATTTPDSNQPDVGGWLSLVSCPAAGECTAVGSYTNKDAGDSDYPWVVSQSGGQWEPGAEALLPANASLGGDLTVGASPFFGFTGLSCQSVGNCTAVGGYENKQDDTEGLILRERNGVWSRGIKAPLPPKAVPNSEPNEFTNPITSLSCSAPGDCAAVGLYVTHVSGTFHGYLLRERNEAWKASALVLPAKAKASEGVFLTSVACRSSGNCIAVGSYVGGGKTHGLIVRERGGKWQRAVNAALPKGAAPATKAHTFLNSVSCPSESACTAGGYYTDRSGKTQGLLIGLRLH
jgi:hypothetical protein